MLFYKNDIVKLSKYVSNLNYLDIGSRGEISGWFKIIKNKLDIIKFDHDEDKILYDKQGIKKFYLTENPKQSSLFKPKKNDVITELDKTRLNYRTIDVKVNTLDNEILGYKKQIDIIKIDTQGSEYEILKGGMERIKKDMPFLFLETWSEEYYEGITLFEEIIFEMRKIGYELYSLDYASEKTVDLKHIFTKNIGGSKLTGLNLFLGPSLKYLMNEKDTERKIKMSFIFFIHNLISFSYKILENDNNEFKNQLKKNIDKRIKFKFFYDLIKIFNYITRYKILENHKLT